MKVEKQVSFFRKTTIYQFVIAICLMAVFVVNPAIAQNSASGGTVRVNFPNSPVAAVLPYYENLTGKRIIQDANLTGVNLTVASAEAMTRSEAIAFIDSIFLLNGYAFIPVDAETLKLVNVTGGKNPRSQGLPVVSKAANLPEGDAVVNYIMTLENISPEDAVRTFSQVVTLNSYGAITPLENAAGVIITENTAVIRSLIELQSHVDVPPAQVSNEFIKLHRADAEKIAEIISSLYEARTGIAPVTGISGGAAPSPANPTAAGVAAAGSGDVFIIPYRRTNSLLVMARPVDVRYIESLVEQFDQPSDGVNFLKRTLNHVSVAEYLPAFYNALARGTDIEEGDNLLDAANTPNFGGQNSGIQNTGFSGGAGAGGASRVTTPDRLSEPEEPGQPQSYVVGNTLLIADPQANSLIVSGSPEHLEIVEKLIDEIDIQPRQVYISTVIGQLNLGDDFGYSLNALQRLQSFEVSENRTALGAGKFLNGDGGRGTAPIADIVDLASSAAFSGATSGLSVYGKLMYGSDDASVSAMINLFTRDTRFRILSRPSIYAQNNVKATISSGQQIAIPTSTLTTTGNNGFGNNQFPGSIASNIEYRDVVLKLEVIPLINSDDQVTLKIAQLNDNITGVQNISGNEVPTLSTQELITTVSVDNGSTIVLGGLITEREEDESTGLPVIRRIPIIGKVLGSTEKRKRREELLIFIQPHIIPSQPGYELPRDTVDLEVNRSEIVEETMEFADPGIFQETGVEPNYANEPQIDKNSRRYRLFNRSNNFRNR